MFYFLRLKIKKDHFSKISCYEIFGVLSELPVLLILFSFVYRLDTILGKAGSKSVDVYESKISLASRIVKVERSVSIFNSYFLYAYWFNKVLTFRK